MRRVVRDKRNKFKEMLQKNTEESKAAYKAAKHEVRKEVARAMGNATQRVREKLEGGMSMVQEGKRELFRMARQQARERMDIAGGHCIRDEQGLLCTDPESKKRMWRTYMERLLNEENGWDGKVDARSVEGEVEKVTRGEVKATLQDMKRGKACGISGVCAEFMIGSGEAGLEALTHICNVVLNGGSMPLDWRDSVLVPLYKGKGDVRECGSYRGVKLLEHGMKVLERVLERRLRKKIVVDEMQCGFMPGRGTIDAIFMVRQLQEKYLGRKKCLYFCFVDLEKAFDRVPRRVIEFALRKKGVEEKLVQAVMRLYEGARRR